MKKYKGSSGNTKYNYMLTDGKEDIKNLHRSISNNEIKETSDYL